MHPDFKIYRKYFLRENECISTSLFIGSASLERNIYCILRCIDTNNKRPMGLGGESKIDFQDGSYGIHFGFPISMILAIFHLHI